MVVKLLTQHHLESLSLKGGCRGSSESTHAKMPHCWKSNALAHIARMMSTLIETGLRSSPVLAVVGLLLLLSRSKPLSDCRIPFTNV